MYLFSVDGHREHVGVVTGGAFGMGGFYTAKCLRSFSIFGSMTFKRELGIAVEDIFSMRKPFATGKCLRRLSSPFTTELL